MPLRVSASLTVLSLGRIEFINPAFHNEKHIFPLGYRCWGDGGACFVRKQGTYTDHS